MAEQIKKLCRQCNKNKRFQNRRLCYNCIRANEKEKRLISLEKKKKRKESTKKYKTSLKKKLKNKCWRLMSEYIRLRASNSQGYVTCITCDKLMKWEKDGAQAGHLFHNRADFSEDNINVQCVVCNKYNSGMREVYTLRLIEKIGLERVQELEIFANQKGNNYSVEELYQIEQYLVIKITKLKKEKGLL